MALIKCTECGKEISDKSKSCMNCGAPVITASNSGFVKIKCNYINGSIMKAKITDAKTGVVLASIAQNGVVDFKIAQDTEVNISFALLQSTKGVLKFEGSHCYEVSVTSGFFARKLVFNEVNHIDSGD